MPAELRETPTLTTRRLILDAPTPADVTLIHEYCQDEEFTRFLSLPVPYRLEDAEFFVRDFVPQSLGDGSEVIFAIRSPRRGFLGVISWRSANADVGFWLGTPHRGRGIMPEALDAVTDWVLTAGLSEVVRWEAHIGNVASAAVARRCAFSYTGRGPGVLATRDGTFPDSWKAELRRGGDGGAPQPWPAESFGTAAGTMPGVAHGHVPAE